MRFFRFSVHGLAIVLAFCGPMLAAQTEHIVQKGETLFGIARQFKVELSALEAANSITDPSKVKVGQKLIIPDGSQSETIQTAAVPTASSYSVKPGDTLYSIARNNKTSVDTLLSLNGMARSSTLKIGQTLKLPGQGSPTNVADAHPSPTPAPNAGTTNPAATPPPVGVVTPVKLTDGANLRWPHNGERFAVQGKLPGVIIHAKEGDAVVAVSSGRVAYSVPHATLGHVIFVQGNNGYVYIYGGNEDSPLKMGDVVNSGDRIGTVGITPGINEAQVYFGVWKKGTYINPALAPRD